MKEEFFIILHFVSNLEKGEGLTSMKMEKSH